MSIAENIKQVLSELPDGVRLVAVSKFHPNEAIEEAYSAGQRVFGESKVQEMTAKYESLPKDIEWHFIGHLQTNKINYIVPYVTLIHGVDNTEQIKAEFRSLNNFFQEAKATWFSNAEWFRELSMGMSHDYHEAIAAGSTLVRVGSKIFGERIY